LTQLFALNRVVVLHALGRDTEALALVAQAAQILRRALGETSPTYLRVERLNLQLQGVNMKGVSGDGLFFT
jgi:hypothetical protein